MVQELDNSPLDDALDILAEVSLKSFTVSPDRIGPFGAAVLGWEVTGPEGFHVELNRTRVPHKSEKIVQPKNTTVFKLVAVAKGATLGLGSLTVSVDVSQCQTYQILNPQNTIEGALRAGIERQENLYFRTIPRGTGSQTTFVTSSPIVTFGPGRIRFKLLLGKSIEHFPDPSVDIDAGFGLDVQDGDLVSQGEEINVDVRVPWYAWLIPGAITFLPIALADAEGDGKLDVRDAIQGLVRLLNFLSHPEDGSRRQSVQIEPTDDGVGIIQLRACPDAQLIRFIKLTINDKNNAILD